MNIEYWILNIEYWIWILNLNIEYWIWILNLSIEFECWAWILNIEYCSWLLTVKVKGYWGWFRSEILWIYFKVADFMCFRFRRCADGDGLRAFFLVLADYWYQRMVGKYLITETMWLNYSIVECGIYTAFGWIHWLSKI